jgi:hypothetical protein
MVDWPLSGPSRTTRCLPSLRAANSKAPLFPEKPGSVISDVQFSSLSKVRLHFTPTYSSWLNQMELSFANIQRDVIDRGVCTSVADLARKLRKYIQAYAKSARPFRWTYTDPQHRIEVSK